MHHHPQNQERALNLSILTVSGPDILGKCFRCRASCDDPRISPLTPQYECPRQSLLIITSGSKDQRNRTEVLFHYSMLSCSGTWACFEHSNFLKVNVPVSHGTQLRAPHDQPEDWPGSNSRPPAPPTRTPNRGTAHGNGQYSPRGGPPAPTRHPTTSFLTAANLIYAAGAGITAAAGTRLALQ
ncbi:hypothetical protein HOLleu_24590 [Holothuria leucospilota]|uniref:Uncharacterized protein n=1 Tax=Holothuria leucospilota TaxID=206669 RepID=A0A9Q1H2U7_HOLLE|nr:hypothetical protein HOLleu_24590 [Holothuria leucospilota]